MSKRAWFANILLKVSVIFISVRIPTSAQGVGVYGYEETASANDIEKKFQYDKFHDATVVSLKHFLNLKIDSGDLNTLMLNVYYNCPGNTRCRPKTVLLSFVAVSDGWRFLKGDKELILLLDAERLSLGHLDWDGDTGDGGRTWETL